MPMKRACSDWWRCPHDEVWDSGDILPLDVTEGEAGVFFYLIGIQAKFGHLPADDDAVAMICRRFRNFRRVWIRVSEWFPLVSTEAGTRRQCAWMRAEQARLDSKRAGDAGRKRDSRGQEAPLSDGVTARGEERRGEEKRGEEKRDISIPRGKRGSTPRKPPSGDHADLIAHWCAEWERTRGDAYAVNGAVDGSAFKRVLVMAKGDLGEAKRRTTKLLGMVDRWNFDHAKPAFLAGEWNQLGVNGHVGPDSSRPELQLYDEARDR
jgi:hypothetical protein